MPMSLEECNALVAKLARQPQFACYREVSSRTRDANPQPLHQAQQTHTFDPQAITEGSKREPIIDG